MPEFHNLNYNPFREKHDHPLVGDLRRQTIRDMVDTVDKCIRDNIQIIGTLIGDYGEGKTFTLQKLRDYLNDSASFASQCSSNRNRSVISQIITASESKLPSNYLVYFYKSFVHGLKFQFFETLVDRLISKNIQISSLSQIADEEYVNVLNHVTDNDNYKQQALYWLLGNKLSKTDLTHVDAMSNIAEEEHARRCFISLLYICKQAGYDAVCVLVDEVEYLFQSAKQAIQCLTSIKRLHDTVQSALSDYGDQIVPLVMILCIVPSTARQMTELIESEVERGVVGMRAFDRRIKEEARFRLDPFSIDDTKQLVELLLSGARQTSNQESGDISPFDEETIRLAHNRAHGVPGFVLDQCRNILEAADRYKQDINQTNAAVWLGIVGEEAIISEQITEHDEIAEEDELV